MFRMYMASAAVVALMTLLAASTALAQDTSSTDADYLAKLAQLTQYGPFCKPVEGPGIPPLPCAEPPVGSGTTQQYSQYYTVPDSQYSTVPVYQIVPSGY